MITVPPGFFVFCVTVIGAIVSHKIGYFWEETSKKSILSRPASFELRRAAGLCPRLLCLIIVAQQTFPIVDLAVGFFIAATWFIALAFGGQAGSNAR